MKKMKKWVIIIFVLALSGVGLWKAGEAWEEYDQKKKFEQATIKEAMDNAEPGTTYVYSEEEIAIFKEEAQKLLEYDIEEFNIQYGENRIVKLQQEASDETEAQLLENGIINKETIRQDRERRRLNEYYTRQDLSNLNYGIYSSGTLPEDIFNKDFSLIKPFVFYGYTSVNYPSLERLRNNKDFLEAFNYFVKSLKILDGYLNETDDHNAIDIIVDMDENFIDDGYSKYDQYTGAVSYLYKVWDEANQKENPMNRLQGLLKVEKLRKINNIIGFATTKRFISLNSIDDVEYTPLDSKFNYWESTESAYFTLFWPSSVTKVDDYTFLIDIDTEKPVDRYGATIISQYIQCRFSKTIEKEYEGEYFKLLIKIDDEIYHDMNQGVIVADVLTGEYMYYDNDKMIVSASENTALQEWQAWFPSAEVRPWVDDYFAIASNSYENDRDFSIFDTIKQVAEKYSVDYSDVENVIMSCYWVYNGWVNNV